MVIRKTRQVVLKPQDFLVVLKLVPLAGRRFTYASLAEELAMSASQVHASLRRAELSRLVARTSEGEIEANQAALREFAIHGAKYAFPPSMGPTSRGIPTAHAGPVLKGMLVQTDPTPPVWPDPAGDTRGMALYPIYPTVPLAAARDPMLYELLSLFDSLRIGAARERHIAESKLRERLA